MLTKRGNFSDLQCELEESPVQTGLVWGIFITYRQGFAQSLMVKNVKEVDQTIGSMLFLQGTLRWGHHVLLQDQRVTVSLQTLRDS